MIFPFRKVAYIRSEGHYLGQETAFTTVIPVLTSVMLHLAHRPSSPRQLEELL
jgi:hypothetical protein